MFGQPSLKGQSTTEFVLIVPLLFLVFFAIIQLAYMAYASFAVQRSALAMARNASLSTPDTQDNEMAFKTQLATSLLPISNLNRKTLLTILASKYKITVSQDRQRVTAQVQYPMPIWVPLVQNIFGQSLVSSVDYNNTTEGQAIRNAFQLFGETTPDLSFEGIHLPVCWITYEETTFNEAYRHPTK